MSDDEAACVHVEIQDEMDECYRCLIYRCVDCQELLPDVQINADGSWSAVSL